MKVEKNSEFFRMYNPNGIRQFRKVMDGDNIISSTSETDGPGTYMTIYCTPSQDLAYLVNYIANRAEYISNDSKLSFNQDVSAERRCLATINKQFITSTTNELLYNSLDSRNSGCTKSIVYSLGVQENFSLVTENHEIITHNHNCQRRIVVDNLFPMSMVVLDGKFIYNTKIEGQQSGLAWHQGDLILFQRQENTNLWYPLNRSLQGMDHYDYVIDLIVRVFPQIDSIRAILMKERVTTASTSMEYQNSSKNKDANTHSKIKEILSKLDKVNLKFPSSPARGYLGPLLASKDGQGVRTITIPRECYRGPTTNR
ncbi:putative secreted effector protein [Blumeria graminis f. sp. tritici 96224]|nr:putative secreted effector protein [Blumeria graminis f. sp. tritici 96224]